MRALLAIASVSLLAACAEPAHTQAPVFEPAASSPLRVGPGSGKVILADLNGDGHSDIVTQHLLQQSIHVMLSDGKGRFVAAAGSPMKLSYQPGTIALGDVNNDRVGDLAVAHRDSLTGEYVSLFISDGRGAFKPALAPRLRTSAAMPFYKPILRLVDLNKDGHVDIVTANARRPTIEVLLGKGNGAFAPATVLSVGPARGLSSFAIDDVDGDRHLDIVAANSEGADLSDLGPSRLVILRGDGAGNFANRAAARSAPAGTVIEALADVNGDGRSDAVITHSDRNILGVL
ncbi:MAG: FG-GAP repeat domain-containing protein, partial [Gemmatimonadaceae bacterium]